MSKDTCSACGTPWTDHPGIQPTCQELQNLKSSIENKEFKVRILMVEDGGMFGGYVSGTVLEKEAVVAVSLKNCAGAIEFGNREQFDRIVQETLAHEILHAVQEIYGQLFSETQIQEALHNPNEMEVAEDVEQMLQQTFREISDLKENEEFLQEKLKRAQDEINDLRRDVEYWVGLNAGEDI